MQTRMAEAIGVSKGHISECVAEPPKAQIGIPMLEALAVYWGFEGYAAMEAQALVEAGHYPVAPEPARSNFPELSAALAFVMGERPMDFLLAARREAEAIGVDRPRREWLAWLDARWWEWQRAHSAAPTAAPRVAAADEEPPPPQKRRPQPKTRGGGGTAR